MNQLTDEELRQAVNSVSDKSIPYATLTPSFKASLRAAIEAEHKRLMGVGVEPFTHFRQYDDGCQENPSKDTIPLYTTDQLAAARLQDQQRIAELETMIESVHSALDKDESKIIRDAKDGYPEGRDQRILSIKERVIALCTYAADWKRWYCQLEAQREKGRGLLTEREALQIARDAYVPNKHRVR